MLTAAEWFALGYGLGVVSLAVYLLWAAVFGRVRDRWHRRRDQ